MAQTLAKKIWKPEIGLLTTAAIVAGLVAIKPILTAAVILGTIGILGGGWVAAQRPYWIVLLLTVYMPFETLILRYLPVSDQIYNVVQFAGEILIYFTFAVWLVRRILTRRTWRKTAVDSWLLAFVVAISVSILVNQAPILGSLGNVRALLRYVVLFYLVVNLDIAPRQVDRLLRVILIVGAIQLTLGVLQLASRGAIDPYLYPRFTNLEVAGGTRLFRLLTRGREIGSLFGSLGDTVFYGLFMLTVMAIYLSRRRQLRSFHILTLALIALAVAYSYVRAVFFGMFLLLIAYYHVRLGIRRMMLVLLLTVPLILSGVIILLILTGSPGNYVNPVFQQQGIWRNVTGIFSESYVEIAKTQRLGALIGIAPTALTNRPLFGFGPDVTNTLEQLNHSRESFLLKPVERAGFEDVYWVAMLAYYGVIGTALFAGVLVQLYKSSRHIYRNSAVDITKSIALTMICLATVTPFLLFFNQVLEYRIYGYFFWLLAGLMFNLWFQEERAHSNR